MEESEHKDPRIQLAIERTLLAWIRTGLALMGFGFVVARFGFFLRELVSMERNAPFHPHPGISLWIGIVMVALGIVVHLLSAWIYSKTFKMNKLLFSYGRLGGLDLAVIVSLLLAIVGTVIVVYLLSLKQ